MKRERIGPKIKKFRKEKAMTQQELADALGYSDKSMITHIEKGDSDMTYEKILLFLRTYMLDANELFDTKDIEEIDKKLIEEHNRPNHDKAVIYIHGLHGSAEEISDYTFLNTYDVIGLDYEDGNPWEVGPIIKEKFEKLIKPYREVVVIANSIGAFYAYEYLSEFNIKQAFFISPIADMCQIIVNLMMDNGISDKELKEKQFITLKDGTVLSYDFYEQVTYNHEDNWKVPTEVLYGYHDELVYIENIADFVANHDARLTIKNDSGHYFGDEEEKQYIKNWIIKNIHH